MKPLPFLLVLSSVFLAGCLEQPADHLRANNGEELSPAPAIELVGRVTDEAGILSDAQETIISQKLERLEATTKHQMVVATVSSLEGREIGPFTTELANAWGIGREDFNDGVVILVAPNERLIRIAVGYGLEGTLTDDVCARIIDEAILPHFRRGDLFSGIEMGVDRLIGALL